MAMWLGQSVFVERGALEALKLIQCPECSSSGQLQILDACGHNVCHECEMKLVNEHNEIACPQCSVFTTRPPGGLVTNYLLADLAVALKNNIISPLKTKAAKILHKCSDCDQWGLATDFVQCEDCSWRVICADCAIAAHHGHRTKLLSAIIQEQAPVMRFLLRSLVGMKGRKVALMVKAAAGEALKLMDCPVCLEQGQLKLLLCGHNICQICEPKLDDQNVINCPLCKADTPHPAVGLQVNDLVTKIAAVLRKGDEQWKALTASLPKFRCDACSGQTVVVSAIQCVGGCKDLILCAQCAVTAGHHQHNFLPLTSTFSGLPGQLLKRIFSNLPAKDIVRDHRVCRRWDKVIDSGARVLAKIYIQKLTIAADSKSILLEFERSSIPTLGGRFKMTIEAGDIEQRLAKKLQHFRVTSLTLNLLNFPPASLSKVVNQMLVPSCAFRLCLQEITVDNADKVPQLHQISRLLMPPVLASGQQQQRRPALRHLTLKHIRAQVWRRLSDDVLLSAGDEQLADLVIECQLRKEMAPFITDAVFGAIDVRNFQRLQISGFCPKLTLNGLRLFLQRWLEAAGSGQVTSDGQLQLNRCAQLTSVDLHAMCQTLQGVVVSALNGHRMTIAPTGNSPRKLKITCEE